MTTILLRRCDNCGHIITLFEKYDYEIIGPNNEKKYTCEKCIEKPRRGS